MPYIGRGDKFWEWRLQPCISSGSVGTLQKTVDSCHRANLEWAQMSIDATHTSHLVSFPQDPKQMQLVLENYLALVADDSCPNVVRYTVNWWLLMRSVHIFLLILYYVLYHRGKLIPQSRQSFPVRVSYFNCSLLFLKGMSSQGVYLYNNALC